ncbi:Ferredoxin--nitrite reductase, chloroplastic [Glycine max]|nr:Ferredoxin--nitrite reductase, chloroplastic [Glycine max]
MVVELGQQAVELSTLVTSAANDMSSNLLVYEARLITLILRYLRSEEVKRQVVVTRPVRTHWTAFPNTYGEVQVAHISFMGRMARDDNGKATDEIELTANDTTIKKQYRKFALQLHSNKNKFAGAKAAFKLIGEAQRVLLVSKLLVCRTIVKIMVLSMLVLISRSNTESHKKKGPTADVSVKLNGKRKRKQVAQSSESVESVSNTDSKEQKQNFYFEESLQNIDEEIKEVRKQQAVGSSNQPDDFVYPDAKFSDFDKDKKEGSFFFGQIWAIYDTIDGMPRFYDVIKKVVSWIQVADNMVEEELPIAYGKHKLGITDTIEDRLMFSHLIACEKIGHCTYKVYPRKGETWALFKN